jgi:peptidylprolyl isomerase
MLKKNCVHALTGMAALLIMGSLHGNLPTQTKEPVQTQEQTSSTASKSDEITQADILKISEAFGHFIGRNLNNPGVKFDLESIIKGMRDGVAGKPAPMSEEQYEEMMTKLQEKAYKKQAEENLKAANSFIETVAKNPQIHKLEENKLYYEVVKEGDGPVVEEHGNPLINYVGKYQDGTVFGSSEDVGGPITIPLDQTIQGFSKGILGMKEGEKRKLYVHPDLGYGTSGHLPPNSLLIFEVEVVKASSPQSADTEEDEDILSLSNGDDVSKGDKDDDDLDDDFDNDDGDDKDEDAAGSKDSKKGSPTPTPAPKSK